MSQRAVNFEFRCYCASGPHANMPARTTWLVGPMRERRAISRKLAGRRPP